MDMNKSGDMDHSGMDHMKMNHSGGMDMDMPMYFHSSTMVTLFFKDWMTMNQKEFNGACVAIFLVAALYEGLKVLRKFITPRTPIPCKGLSKVHAVRGPPSGRMRIAIHLVQTLLHIIQVFLGYLMMLAFMTYNTLICVSVLLGYGVGYLAFAWMTPPSKTEEEDADCCNM